MNKIISKPKILFPKESIDLNKWAVIACDQFTSPNENYWQKVEKYVGNNPSTLNLIFPEYYLSDKKNIDRRIEKIHQTMREYLEQKILKEQSGEGNFIYTKRKLSNGKTRQGLIVLLDLEAYSYKKDEKLPIRPTEGIVEDRLPIRMKIRDGAPLEFPHILMLVDDLDKQLIEPLGEKLEKHQKLYDFELMMDGGHAEGYAITSPEIEQRIFEIVDGFGKNDRVEPPIAIAVGDGNHSLASAKAIWEKTKETLISQGETWENSPARYAMAEIINIYDEALEFEAIHRVLFDVGDIERFKDYLIEQYKSKGSTLEIEYFAESEYSYKQYREELTGHGFLMVYEKDGSLEYAKITLSPGIHSISVGSLQIFVDDYLKSNPHVSVDYIHGTEAVLRDSAKEGNVGFFLAPIDKNDLFKTVAKEGVTPRKTFSMGEADTKAYYIIGRKII